MSIEALKKTRLWIDTEFNEFRGELISIALVDESGREFYEVLPPPLAGYGPWVAQNVVPILNKPAIPLAALQAKLQAFLADYEAAHLIADWPEDIEHFLKLLIVGPGQRIGPYRWTMEVRRDLPNTADVSAIPHNALEDAKALRACDLLLDAAIDAEAKPVVLTDAIRAEVIKELCAGEEPVYQLRVAAKREDWFDCSPEDYGIHAGSGRFESRILYPASTVAALKARVAGLERALGNFDDGPQNDVQAAFGGSAQTPY